MEYFKKNMPSFREHETSSRNKNCVMLDGSKPPVSNLPNTFSPPRKTIDKNKTFQLISKHLSPPKLKTSLSKSSRSKEKKSDGSDYLKRKSDSYNSTSMLKAFDNKSYTSNKQSFLKSVYSTDNDKKSPSSDVNDKKRLYSSGSSLPSSSYTSNRKRLSSCVATTSIRSNDSFIKTEYPKPVSCLNYELNKSVDNYCSFPGSSSRKSFTDDDLFERRPIKKLKRDSDGSTLVNRRVSLGNSFISDKNENLKINAKKDCLLSQFSSTPKTSLSLRTSSVVKSSLSSWEVSSYAETPSKASFKRKESDEHYSCHSSWEITSDDSFRSPSSVLPNNEGTRVVSLSEYVEVDYNLFERRLAKKVKTDSIEPLPESRRVSFGISSISNSFTGKGILSTQLSSKAGSSYVIYDECSSEEEMYWDADPFFKRKFSFGSQLNTSRETKSSISNRSFDKCSDSDYSTCKSEDENDTFVTPPRKRYKYDTKSSIMRSIITDLYRKPLDLDTISNIIDLRLINKHDKWIYFSRKSTIFILGDSHTRFLVNGMEKILPGFRIYTFCKPSAKTEQVFSGAENSISELTKRDFLILFCGTNDMWDESTDQAEECMGKKLDKIKNTNVLVCNVPRNYSESDTSYVQKNISVFNKFLTRTVKKYNNIVLVNLNRLKKDIFFTQHGLHFNGTGKVKICEILSHKLVDVLDDINTK